MVLARMVPFVLAKMTRVRKYSVGKVPKRHGPMRMAPKLEHSSRWMRLLHIFARGTRAVELLKSKVETEL